MLTEFGSDGLKARPAGSWTERKLYYVERYLRAFATAMGPKRAQKKWEKLVYLDLLCGPGICVNRETGAEFDGSPLRAAKLGAALDELHFVDADEENVAALRSRLARIPARADCRRGDCNEEVGKILANISSNALILAFVDPEGLEVKFSTFEQLARKKAADVIYLFPSGGIVRNAAMFLDKPGTMDAFWGAPDWRRLAGSALAPASFTDAEVRAGGGRWVSAFQRKMKGIGFPYFTEWEPLMTNDQNAPMYHLLFFSKHPVGLKIWKGIKQIEPNGQRLLGLDV